MPSLGPIELLIIVVVLAAGAAALGGIVLAALAATRRSDAARPPQPPLEERLRELDDLRARGVISEQEHAAARSRALGA